MKPEAPHMNTLEKLEILSAAAKYDVSCASSGSKRKASRGGLGNAESSGICHSWSADGRCISLLKILFSNACMYNCAYCINRCENPIPRATFTVQEVVDLTMNFYRRNYIEGLFLSSGVVKSPDHTMEKLVDVIKTLRTVHRFNGYIHIKAIPGASKMLIDEAGLYTDRLSVNIELPSEESLKKLAPQKEKQAILKPMKQIHSSIIENKEERKKSPKAPLVVPAGQSTQLIVGASPDSDRQIMKLSSSLYSSFELKRVYYSAFVPVNEDQRLLPAERPDMLREHRLYQADWLIRLYGFSFSELLTEENPHLDKELDPKTIWALNNPQSFPINVNTAPYELLLRVPGIGFFSAARIRAARKFAALRLEDLRKLGVVMKRAQYFVHTGHESFMRLPGSQTIRRSLLQIEKNCLPDGMYQPELFKLDEIQ